MRASILCLASGGLMLATQAAAADDGFTLKPSHTEFFGNVAVEVTAFAQEPAFADQDPHDFSIAARPTLLFEWADGDLAFTLTPFARLDTADDRRTHFDLREAKIDCRANAWSLTVGADFVFWGKTEAVHLVDIVNSDDAVESLDLEDKLGQPMVKVARTTDYGQFSAFWLPFFREPTFAGKGGRLRAGLPVDTDAARFAVSGEEWAQSAALRWGHVIGDVDFGLSGFYGVSRDAALEPFTFSASGAPTSLRPVYDDIVQIGFDGQYTSGPALWKIETIGRFNQLDRNVQNTDYIAVTGGLEYTFFGVAGTNADVGLILEGAYDSRGNDALTVFEEDVICGMRLALNDERDSAFLMFGATDVRSGSTSLRLEAETRIADGWKLELEGQAFLNPQPEELESTLESDSFLRVKLAYFW